MSPELAFGIDTPVLIHLICCILSDDTRSVSSEDVVEPSAQDDQVSTSFAPVVEKHTVLCQALDSVRVDLDLALCDPRGSTNVDIVSTKADVQMIVRITESESRGYNPSADVLVHRKATA